MVSSIPSPPPNHSLCIKYLCLFLWTSLGLGLGVEVWMIGSGVGTDDPDDRGRGGFCFHRSRNNFDPLDSAFIHAEIASRRNHEGSNLEIEEGKCSAQWKRRRRRRRKKT
jgi:hypothetical protein